MTFSPTAIMLAKAIDASGLSQVEIVERCGLRHASTLDDIKCGEMQVPLESIPALARTLNMDERKFMSLAIQEYHPGVYEVLVEALGIPKKDAELGVGTMFRLANIRGQVEIEGPLRAALEGMLALAALSSRS